MWSIQDAKKTGVDKNGISSIVAKKPTSIAEKYPLATKLLLAVVTITVTYFTRELMDKLTGHHE